MSISTHFVAFRPPDEKWQRMKEVYDACKKAGINIPKEVGEFFEYENPDPNGVQVDIEQAVEDWNDGDMYGYEIDLSKLPDNTRYVRVFYSC